MSVPLSPAVRAKVQPFVQDGRLSLSSGAIKRAFENNGHLEEPVFLQVTNFRWNPPENAVHGICARVKIFDGRHYYRFFFFSDRVSEQLKKDEIVGKSTETGKGGEVIMVSKAHFARDIPLKSGATVFVIDEYVILGRGIDLMDVNGEEYNGSPEATTSPRDSTPKNTYFISWSDTSLEHIDNDSDAGTSRLPPPDRSTSDNVTPIMGVTPYATRWRILGKCSATQLRTTQKGEKMFSFALTDSHGTEMRFLSFGNQALRAHGLVQKNCVYYFSSGEVKQAKKEFSAIPHDYEIILRPDSEITPCNDVEITLPAFSLDICSLERAVDFKDTPIDILAVIDELGPIKDFTSIDGKALTKRDMYLIDQTNSVIRFTLWNDEAREFEDQFLGKVIGIKGAVVREWNGGFSLTSIFGTKWEVSPILPEDPAIYEWYRDQRRHSQTKNLTSTIAGSQETFSPDSNMIGPSIECDVLNRRILQVKARIGFINGKSAIYQACVHCKKKVIAMEQHFHCINCTTLSEKFTWRYVVKMEIYDLTGSMWVTAFEDAAVKIFGKTSIQMGQLREIDSDEYQKIFDEARSKNFMFRIEAKSKIYNDRVRIDYQVLDVSEVPWDRYISELEKALDTLERI